MPEHTVTDPIWYPIVMTALVVAIALTAAVLAHALVREAVRRHRLAVLLREWRRDCVDRARWDRTGRL